MRTQSRFGTRFGEYLRLHRLAKQLAAFRPDGFHCSLYRDEARRANSHCGGWYSHLPVDKEPFPEGFINSKGVKVAWPVFQCEDGLWRSLPGTICTYTLTEEKVEDLRYLRGLQLVRDQETGWLCLVESDGTNPIIERHHWTGDCTHCGLCCFAPRLDTGQPCAALRPGRPS